MPATEWQQVQDVFLAVVDLPAHLRSKALDELCAGNPALRSEVTSLLNADTGSVRTFDEAIRGLAGSLLDGPEERIEPGSRLGAYRVVHQVGRGGMGSVYLGLRDDDEFVNKVALKVVRSGGNGEQLLRRFREERQILANLNHPYIARLFDGGSTPDGIPFFAMEFVEGQPIDAYCALHGLDVRARCRLFLRVVEAVGYAHRNMVVHGDLKPANIFVTADGTPKLLDFGVAELIGERSGLQQQPSQERRAFTPTYASPEQMLGKPVTASTDVYSLGAVLYELLCGKRTQPVDGCGSPENGHAAGDAEAQGHLLVAAGIPLDLRAVLLKALRRDPEERYDSTSAFGEDLERCFASRPVRARANTVRYRASKFLVRNRAPVLLGGVIACSLIGGLAVSLVQMRRAEVERARADAQREVAVKERANAEASRAGGDRQRVLAEEQRSIAQRQERLAAEQRRVADTKREEAQREKGKADRRLHALVDLSGRTLFDIHDALAPLPGALAVRKHLVETTLAYLKELEKSAGDDDDVRQVLTGGYYQLAMIQGSPRIGSLQDSLAAEKSLRLAEASVAPGFARHPNDKGWMFRWIETRSMRADLEAQAGHRAVAAQMFTDLLPVARRLAETQPDCIDCRYQQTAIGNYIAGALMNIDPASALRYARMAMEEHRRLLLRWPDNVSLKQQMGVIAATEAGAYKALGRLEEAGKGYRESLAIREELLRKDPDDAAVRRGIMVVSGNYAALLGAPAQENLGRPGEARMYAAKSVEMARALVQADGKNALARRDLAMSLGRFGMIEPVPGEVAGSLKALEEAQALMEPLLTANPKAADLAVALAGVLEMKAKRLIELGRPEEAAREYRRSLAVIQPLHISGNAGVLPQWIADDEGLARLCASMGQIQDALAYARDALQETDKTPAQGSASERHAATLAGAWATLADVQTKSGLLAEARQSAQTALQLWQSVHNAGVLTPHRKQMDETALLLARED